MKVSAITGLCFAILTAHCAEIPAPPIQWQIGYGGTSSDQLWAAFETLDGGYLLAGSSASTISGNRTVARDGYDHTWIVRLDSKRNDLWQKSLVPRLFGALEAQDRSLLLWGETSVVKLDSAGGRLWEYTNTGAMFSDALLLPDGDLLVCGWKAGDALLVRLASNGRVIWERIFPGEATDAFASLVKMNAEEFWLAGYSSSPPGLHKTAPKRGVQDIWLVAVNGQGERLWDQTFGGPERTEYGVSIARNFEGTVALTSVMWPESTNAVVFGRQDAHVLLFNKSGSLLSEAFHGCSDWDHPIKVVALPDGGFAISVASTLLTDGNKTAPGFGREDWWILRLDRNGAKLWEKCLGGSDDDRPIPMSLTKDYGLLVGGWTRSGVSGCKTTAIFGEPSSWNYDYWLVKLGPDIICTPPKLRVPRQLPTSIAENGFELFLTGSSNLLYVLEHSTDLVTWIPFATNVGSGFETRVVDRTAANTAFRIYRARLIP